MLGSCGGGIRTCARPLAPCSPSTTLFVDLFVQAQAERTGFQPAVQAEQVARAAAVSTLQRSVDAENTARTLEDRALRSTMTASLAPLQSKATRGSPENDARVSTLESRTTAMLATLSTQVDSL